MEFRDDNDTLCSIQSRMDGNRGNGRDSEAELNDSAVENDSERVRSEIHGLASGESNTQLSDDEDDHEEYGVNRMNFDTKEKEIEQLRKEYHIPDDITLRLLGEAEMVSKFGDGETAIYMEMFRLGFRLPIQPYFARMLVRLGLSPGQLDPNGWRILCGMYVVWAEQNKVEPCFKEFMHLYLCIEHGVGHKGWYYFMSKSKNKRIVLDFPGSCKGWKNKYFAVGGNWGRDVELTKGWFKVPTQFSRPVTWKKNVSISDRLRAKVERDLLHAEDWKFLLTPKRLFSTDLISGLPQHTKRTRRKGNMSFVKRTPAEIAKALVEEISNEEGGPQSKKPPRAVHKNKAGEKKDKQPAASVRNALPQYKDGRAGDSRPLRILPSASFSICSKGDLLESEDIVELKRERVESLLPVLNLAAQSINQNAFNDFSHLMATYALELLARIQAEQSLLLAMHIETFFKSLKGQEKLEELERVLSKAKLNNEKMEGERDRLKQELNARIDENAQLAEDLVKEKRSNVSKDSKIAEPSHEVERVKVEMDQRIRSEKKQIKAGVIQTCIELFQEKHPDMDFQWMLTAYVSKERARKKSIGTGLEENHNPMLQSGEVEIEGEAFQSNRVIKGQEETS